MFFDELTHTLQYENFVKTPFFKCISETINSCIYIASRKPTTRTNTTVENSK